MKVFKFGGASVKDAEGVRNVGDILQQFNGEHIVVVVSAMGKTTNALELLAENAYNGQDYSDNLFQIQLYHQQIIDALAIDFSLNPYIALLQSNIAQNKNFPFPKYYDQIVSIGEIISSEILSRHLNKAGITNTWVDARTIISTDESWREGNVNWEKTILSAVAEIPTLLETGHVVTQGFIAGTPSGLVTTLGREGSDYTAAVLSNCLEAEGLWIWKDVPGVLTADPKEFSQTEKIPELTYYEAIEMTYYGAQVIHPKTIKPLQNKHIPLYVRSFVSPETMGTRIQSDTLTAKYPPVIVLKKNQLLMSISTTDFSFIAEHNLSHIYNLMAWYKVKANMMQNAALSFSVVVDDNPYKVGPLREKLSEEYKIKVNENLELLTIRHYNADVIEQLTANKEILVTQKTRQTIQFLISNH